MANPCLAIKEALPLKPGISDLRDFNLLLLCLVQIQQPDTVGLKIFISFRTHHINCSTPSAWICHNRFTRAVLSLKLINCAGRKKGFPSVQPQSALNRGPNFRNSRDWTSQFNGLANSLLTHYIIAEDFQEVTPDGCTWKMQSVCEGWTRALLSQLSTPELQWRFR
jgi:hypothetical protein